MLKHLIKYLLLIPFIVPALCAEPGNFKISIPEFIPMGKSFQVSLQTSKIVRGAESLNIFIMPDASLILSEAELWHKEGKTNLEVSPVYLTRFAKSSYQLSVDLTTDYFEEQGTYFQVILNFVPVNNKETEFYLLGEFKNNENVSGYLETFNKQVETDIEYLYRYSVNFYEENSIAGQCAQFNPASSLIIPLKYKTDSKLAINFQIKHQSFSGQFLRIVDGQNRRTEFTIELNEFQILRISSDFHEQIYLKPKFVSNNSWYSIQIVFHLDEPYIFFYCEDEELAKFKLKYQLDEVNPYLEFVNLSTQHTFCVDQFRIINLKGDSEQIKQQRNFVDFLADSSVLLLQINFANNELNKLKDLSRVIFNDLKLVNSDAPIFPRAPEINLKIMNNYFEVTWESGDDKNVSYYVLERATGEGGFTEIARRIADQEPQKNYNLLCEKTGDSEIMYYRLKQVNKDKTVVYSDIIKIGLGVVEDFVLEQNYPNPFNPRTQIKLELIQDGDVDIQVYNLAGKEVALLHRGFLTRGIYQFEFDGSDLPSGIYLYQVTTALSTQTRKMILAK